MSEHGLIILFTGPSGAGKDTLAAHLRESDPRIQPMITATTRAPRSNEQDGVDYYFLSKAEFEKRLDNDAFLEWSRHYENYYGALKQEIHSKLDKGVDLYTDITVSGAFAMKSYLPDHVVHFLIMPPSLEALNQRMASRRSETGELSEKQQIRLEKIQHDIQHWQKSDYTFTNEDMKDSRLSDYDYVIVNDDLAAALNDIRCAIHAERLKRRF